MAVRVVRRPDFPCARLVELPSEPGGYAAVRPCGRPSSLFFVGRAHWVPGVPGGPVPGTEAPFGYCLECSSSLGRPGSDVLGAQFRRATYEEALVLGVMSD